MDFNWTMLSWLIGGTVLLTACIIWINYRDRDWEAKRLDLAQRAGLTDRIFRDLESGVREHQQLVENRFRDMQEVMNMAADIGANLRLRGWDATPPKLVSSPKPVLPPARQPGVRRIRG